MFCLKALWGSIHFSFCSPHWLNQVAYIQIGWLFLLPVQIYWWVPVIYFLILGTVISSQEFLFTFLAISIFLLVYSISWDKVAMLFFNSSYLYSFYLLFILWMGHMFVFLCRSCNFLPKTGHCKNVANLQMIFLPFTRTTWPFPLTVFRVDNYLFNVFPIPFYSKLPKVHKLFC